MREPIGPDANEDIMMAAAVRRRRGADRRPQRRGRGRRRGRDGRALGRRAVRRALDEGLGVDEAGAELAGVGARVSTVRVHGRVGHALEEVAAVRGHVHGLAEREDARDVGAGHGRAVRVAVVAARVVVALIGHGGVDADAGRGDVDPVAVAGEARGDAVVVRRGDGDGAVVVGRVPVAIVSVVARGEDDEAVLGVVVVDRVELGLVVDAGLHVTPGVGRDLGAVVGAVDEGLGEAAHGVVAKGDADHELGARVGRPVAAGDARDALAVVRVGGDGAAAVRAVPVVAHEVRARVVGEVVAVAVVDVAVVVVVDAVAADLARVLPDVVLEVRVLHVDTRVDDLDDDVRVAHGRVPGARELDRVVVRLAAELRVVRLEHGLVLELGLDVGDAVVVLGVEEVLELLEGRARDLLLVGGLVRALGLVPHVEAERLLRRLVLARVAELALRGRAVELLGDVGREVGRLAPFDELVGLIELEVDRRADAALLAGVEQFVHVEVLFEAAARGVGGRREGEGENCGGLHDCFDCWCANSRSLAGSCRQRWCDELCAWES
mmetsp:Transcript_32275/g.104883  ORF Transcript_32275/g.104883 Transcript_32275/m.104883 type:complete len:551 (+) Transcript_32275:1059-2711(+)